VTLLVLVVSTAESAQAQTFTTLHEFVGTDGSNAYAGLVQATDGNLYGTTTEGGANNSSLCTGDTTGCGTVFKITPTGTVTTLYNFCAQNNCTDGTQPTARLVQAANGNFYGTAFGGGANVCLIGGINYGCGTVFEITSAGTLTTLHSFDGTDGEFPEGALVQATNGDFYGTTSRGGANGSGTVFEITPRGTLTTLHSFCQGDCSDGAGPDGALVQATNGDFYGTTAGGVSYGTVFEITPSGTLSTLHSFEGADGASPFDTLIQATDGNFYGTTILGGASTVCSLGCGTVFKITPTGTLTTLHSFDGTDGSVPYAGLVQATNGNFYGTTNGGGADGDGTVFEITPSGTLTTLHSFDDADGDEPFAGLVQDTNGSFYGTTEFGGDHNGTVFSLSVALGQFVETQTTSGKVGAAVKILGTNLTGATSVTFNGTAATFTVVSKSEISTMVPTGATTGTVEVATPRGTLKSNTKFRVAP
jgi:uncharacterized repeat protein (TIGR03803 family)